MSGMIGADPDALERLAGDFDRGAGSLESLVLRVRTSVHANPWAGARATRFRTDWDQRHGPQLKRTATSLRTAAKQLRQQAAEQRQASSAGGLGSSATITGSGAQRPWWMRLDPKLGQDKLFTTLDILLGMDQVRIDRALKDLKGTPIGEYLRNAGSRRFFNTVGRVSGVIGLLGSLNDLGVGIATGDDARISAGARGIVATGLGRAIPVLGVAAAAAELYGQAMLPTTQEGFDGTTDRALRQRFGKQYDPSNVTVEQANWLTGRYEGVGGFFNSMSDGIDYQMRWLGDPAAKAGADFGKWRRQNGWPW